VAQPCRQNCPDSRTRGFRKEGLCIHVQTHTSLGPKITDASWQEKRWARTGKSLHIMTQQQKSRQPDSRAEDTNSGTQARTRQLVS
jgi:hypothetical protein